MNATVVTVTATARVSELRKVPVGSGGFSSWTKERSSGREAATSIGVLHL